VGGADGAGEAAILGRVPPEAVDAEDLDVDPLLVDERDAVGPERTASPASTAFSQKSLISATEVKLLGE